ncbi:MAG TPA: T9SS type A sorting domain-containing protein, partial [Calditrichia bacterium]|nr:T9SS type A sorting domain-containing protein [Calditrichia bacterium]
ISYGRTADGGPDWQFFSAPTPGRNNAGVNGVENDYPVYPRSFTLEQNYPNPFNPATTIRFSIARSSWVKIRLYDVLGREIRVLLDKNLTPGSYSVRLGSEGLASGVYLYTLQAEGFFGAKKLLLLK